MPAIDPNESPLAMRDPRNKPNVSRLLSDVKTSLTVAHSQRVFERMLLNREARYTIWDMKTGKCRKPTRRELSELGNGVRPEDVFPFPGSADHEVKVVDEVINEHVDMLMVAGNEARRSILPAGRDATNEERMQAAEDWGAIRDDCVEEVEEDLDDALTQCVDWAFEQGHSVMFMGYQEKKQLMPREITAEEVRQMLVSAALEEAEAQRRAQLAMAHDEGMAEGEDAQESLLSEDEQMQLLMMVDDRFESILWDANVNARLVPLLQQYDPEMPTAEAKRVARSLRKGEVASYFVPTVVSAAPEAVRLRPGINIWYPIDTTRIRHAPFIVTIDWLYDYELREKCEADDEEDRWDSEVVEEIIAAGPTHTSAHVLGLSDLPTWVLSGTHIGVDLEQDIFKTEGRGRYRILTIYYKATAMGGVPALFRTIVADSAIEKPLHDCCARDAHGQYPLIDYVREANKDYLWESRGVGEVTFSEQEEERIHVNFCSDNASLKIKPPLNVPMTAERGRLIIEPGKQIPTRRAGESGSGISKIDIAGECTDSIESMKMAIARVNRYWLRGKEYEGTLAQRNRWKRLGRKWEQFLKRVDKMMLQTIAQYMPDDLLAQAMGMPVERLSREDILRSYSLTVAVDMDALDPKTMENRAKLMREYVTAMDTQGLVDLEPLLRELMMTIVPRWGKLIKNRKSVQREDQEDIVRIMTAALQGIDSPFVQGKDHTTRAEMIQQLIDMPAMDEGEQPIVDEQTGQPVPGRVNRIMRENPDAAAAVMRRLKFEQFWAAQGKNALEGRKGVSTQQQVAM